VLRYKPKILAVLGLGAYRTAFEDPKAKIGRQHTAIGETILWALPNPSGLNAHYQRDELTKLFVDLKRAADH
jgi:TDG/mug DNA glycosylase family protein